MQNNSPIIDALTPVGFRVLVNIYKKPNTTDSGFILPEQENQGMPCLSQITVLGKKTIQQKTLVLLGLKPKYKVGTWVYFRKYSVDEIIIETPSGKMNLYVLEEPEIIGLVKSA